MSKYEPVVLERAIQNKVYSTCLHFITH